MLAPLAMVLLASVPAATASSETAQDPRSGDTAQGSRGLTLARELLEEARRARDEKELESARAMAAEAIEGLTAELGGDDEAARIALLSEVAAFSRQVGDPRATERAWRWIVDARTRTYPGDHSEVQRARASLAAALQDLGDLAGARVLLEQVLEARLRTLDDEHPDLQVTRHNLANTLRLLGDLAGAQALLEKVLEVFARTLPDDHPDVVTARGSLANALRQGGDLARARVLQEQVLEARSRTLPDEHPHLQAARQSLAITMRQLGDLQRARALEEKVLAVRTRSLPPDHPELVGIRQSLAATLYALGDMAGARALQEQVLAVLSRTLPDDHPELQRARGNLGNTLRQLGEVAVARVLQEKVLEVFTRTLRDDHPDLQTARNNLAVALYSLGEYQAARALFEQVVVTRSRTQPDVHPDLQAARSNLGETIRALGDLEGARALQEQVLAIRTRTLPDEHLDLQAARENLALTLAAERLVGREEDSGRERFSRLALDFTRALRRSASITMLDASSREAEERAVRQAANLGLALSFASGLGVFERDAELEQTAFLLSESLRGIAILSAGLARRGREDSSYAELRARMRAASAELAGLAQRGASAQEFDAARSELEAAERALVQLGARLAGGAANALEPELSALAAELGDGEAWVAYRRYTRTVMQPGDPPREQATEDLCAFVLRRGPDSPSAAALARIELGSIAPIEAAVERWRAAMGVGSGTSPLRGVAAGTDKRSSEADGGQALRALVFDPLEPVLAGITSLVIAPDDVLHLVPLDALEARAPTHGAESPALPEESAARLLGEVYSIQMRATLLELVLPGEPRRETGALVALGDPDHDREPSEEGAAGEETGEEQTRTGAAETSAPAPLAAPHRPEESGGLRGSPLERGFSSLPETRAEVRAIQGWFERVFGAEAEVLVLERRAASRASLTALAHRARFLHVATHGWFTPAPAPAEREPIEARMGLAGGARAEMSPLLLCGLALAGANLPADALGRVPGLVTAEEIAALDLAGCELAVLSACDTNVGLRRAGQGVASLQRALHMAGARSVITSLWKVPDAATKELMADFYRRLWDERKPEHRALWEAKMALRDAEDASGLPKYSLRDWGAWVLTGDPR